MSAAATVTSSHAYCRAARRLRRLHAGRPAALYRSLRELSDSHDRRDFARSGFRTCTGSPEGLHHNEPPAVSRTFAQMVVDRLEGGVLRYSARAQLLAAAADMGLGRFQANLIIAAVQHEVDPAETRGSTASSPLRGRLIIAMFIVLQSAIVLAAWGLWFQ